MIPLVLGEHLIDETIQPAFARFSRGDERMAADERMPARVTIRRRVAAEGGAARLTRAEMDPPVAGLYALLAVPAFGSCDLLNLIHVRAALWHG